MGGKKGRENRTKSLREKKKRQNLRGSEGKGLSHWSSAKKKEEEVLSRLSGLVIIENYKSETGKGKAILSQREEGKRSPA